MARRSRWILLALVVVLLSGAVALVLSQRPELDDARRAVDTRWHPLQASDALVLRYQKLEGALSAFDAAGGKGRTVSNDLHHALVTWDQAVKARDTAKQAEAADALEALATRLRANVNGSDRLKADPAVTDALTAFAGTKPATALIDAYNASVRKYEDVRTSTLARPVARVLGYDERPVLVLGI